MFIKNTLLLFCVFITTTKTDDDNLLCMTHYTQKYSKLTIQSDLHLRDHAFDCINVITNGSNMFTISSPNELFLIPSDNIDVFGEFRLNEDAFDKSQSTVVLTTDKANLENLKGLQYCHPGANVTTIPPWVLNEFITTILNNPKNSKEIPSNQSLLEYNYSLLNATLGPSCLRNVWSNDENQHNSFEKLYPKLFELCHNYIYKDEIDQFANSLLCLLSEDRSIAVTTLGIMNEYKDKINAVRQTKEIFSLCKNNTLQKLDNPCVWRTTSWPILIGKKNYTEHLPEIQKTLKNFTPFPNSIPLSNYTKEFIEHVASNVDTSSIEHNRNLNWCTLTQEEQADCKLLQKVFSFYDILIKITSCVKAEADYLDKYECINKIQSGSSSVTFIHSDQFFAAKRANLNVAVYADTGANVIKSILLVNTTSIKTIDDLQNKKGCFSEYGSIDWLSFVSAYKFKILKSSCFYDEELSKFVDESCMPGIKDDLRKRKESVNVERVCKICEASSSSPTAVNCNADQNVNIFATSRGALDCLMKPVGQFAVVRIDNNYNISTSEIGKDVKVMCKNGTLVEFNEIDDECYLSITPYGGIVTKKGLEEDVKSAFLDLKERNLQYGLLPHDYIKNLFGNIFPEKFIKEFLDVATCNKTTANGSCKHILNLDNMIQETDTCPNDTHQVVKGASIVGIIVGIVLSCLVLLGLITGYIIYRKYKIKNNENTENNENNENETEIDPLNRPSGNDSSP